MRLDLGSMILRSLVGVVVGWSCSIAMAAPVSQELEMAASYLFVPEVVDTDRILNLDPEMMNPHHARWVLNRKVELKGFEVQKRGAHRFGIQIKGIESHALGYLRGDGPWYRPMSEFPCAELPDDRFGTEEGSRKAVDQAGKKWRDILRSKLSQLATQLHHVSASSPEAALKKGLQVYRLWLRELQNDWQTDGYSEARRVEWSYYRMEANRASICQSNKKERKAGAAGLPWSAMMEPHPPLSPQLTWERPLARAPARRWDGMFSVRLNIEIGSRVINGQFLIDSDTPKSVISSAWLTGEGILTALIRDMNLPPEPVSVMGESGMAYIASVDRVSMSGSDLDLEEFLIFETDFFIPPETRSTCCDGILGADFLKKYVVQFNPGQSNEVILWSREKFRPVSRLESEPSKTGTELVHPTWIETHFNSNAKLVSEGCRFIAGQSAWNRKVSWDTGNDAGLEVFSKTQPAPGTVGTLQCDQKTLIKRAQLETRTGMGPREFFGAGIGFLARGPFILDLPHGRIWFSKPTLEAPILKNETGLALKYFFEEGDRVLKVVHSDPTYRGLRSGDRILRMDSRPAESMDQWEVTQRLSGAFGNEVVLEWLPKSGKEPKRLKLNVSQKNSL